MVFSGVKRLLTRSKPPACARAAARRYRPMLEPLENRLVPVTAVTDLTTLTANNLVTDLVGPGVSFSNVKYTGAALAAGIFSGGANSIGIETGVVLSSGKAKDVVGPNNSPSNSTAFGTPSDAQLDAIVAPGLGFDASVLEFDFVPKGNVLSFKYVFGSEEYPEFVGSAFNDVFAFFLNGKNVALLPGTTTAVSINNVNAGLNSQFFVDNTTATHFTQMDGFTTVLSVVINVQKGQTNHIKLAIEDVADAIYDSWVLIKAGSFQAADVHGYHPLRYIFSQTPSDPSGGYEGDLTIANFSNFALDGPLFAVLPQLPAGVTLENPDGFTPSGHPFLRFPNGSGLPAHGNVRFHIRLKNPQNVHMSTFFLDFPIEVTGILS